MLARRRPSHHTPACNDNGPFSAVRSNATAPLVNIIRVATDTAGPITVSYVAEGVLIITGV